MRMTSLVAAIAAHTSKIWKNRLRVFKRKFAKNGILNFAFRLNQSSGITF